MESTVTAITDRLGSSLTSRVRLFANSNVGREQAPRSSGLPDGWRPVAGPAPSLPRLTTVCWIWLLFFCWLPAASSADRTTLLVPLGDEPTSDLPTGAVYPDQAFGDSSSDGWKAYIQLWKAHHDDPTEATIRRYLGLPLDGKTEVTQRPGRAAPSWLAWQHGSYTQLSTPHFVLYSRADQETSLRVAEDLERCYWVWTQMFFPLWECQPQVTATLGGDRKHRSIVELLRGQSSRLTARRKLRIVLFRDAAEYQQTINVPGVERSTGFYSDEKQTTFLYGSAVDDPPTRRHELVHQLFREATSSGLGRQMPGTEAEFWLIEGIAGYFESLHFGDGYATVGGWDSPRLQFARFRFFVLGDRMPMSELRKDGRLNAQSRSDIARWYAHAIAQSHHLLDCGNANSRRWVYGQLAKEYKIETTLGFEHEDPVDGDSILKFLSVDDEHLADNPVERNLNHLCLAGCMVTPQGLNHIPPAPELQRLTLTGRQIGVDAVVRLAADPRSIQQLSLERTGIDPTIAGLLNAAANLEELDLSSTAVDDSIVSAIAAAKSLNTLWLTGTHVTDRSIAIIAKMPELEDVDLQRTKVTETGIAKLKQANPNLNVNPLEIQ